MSGEIRRRRDGGRVTRTGLPVGLFARMRQDIIVSTRNSHWRIRVETTQSVAARIESGRIHPSTPATGKHRPCMKRPRRSP